MTAHDDNGIAERISPETLDADGLRALWDDRVRRLDRFVGRELAAYALLGDIGQHVGVDDQASMEQPTGPDGQTLHRRIVVGDEEVQLGESYVRVPHQRLGGGGKSETGYRKVGVMPFVRVFERGAQEPHLILGRREFLAICIMLQDGVDGRQLFGDVLGDRLASSGAHESITAIRQREQDAYIGYLTRAALSQGIAIPAELQ